MQEVVGVVYRAASKVYYFSPNGYELKPGDKVIVDTAGGEALAIIAHGSKWVEDSEVEEPLKKVLKIATENDVKRADKLKEKALKQIPIIEEKIKSLNLNMKVIDAEYSFDEVKITISFTSDGRVDFRELLKVLASALKVKIELRQVSGKEEVKMIGGLGLCGMPCCCTRFLQDAEHVTVKSVKLQNLSMNPSKTGGLCGKMMCCLAFEEKTYKELAKEIPAVGDCVTLLDGTVGTVTAVSLLKGEFSLKVALPGGSYKIRECSKADLLKEENIKPAETKKEEQQVAEKVAELKGETIMAEESGGKEEKKEKKNFKKKFHKFKKGGNK